MNIFERIYRWVDHEYEYEGMCADIRHLRESVKRLTDERDTALAEAEALGAENTRLKHDRDALRYAHAELHLQLESMCEWDGRGSIGDLIPVPQEEVLARLVSEDVDASSFVSALDRMAADRDEWKHIAENVGRNTEPCENRNGSK